MKTSFLAASAVAGATTVVASRSQWESKGCYADSASQRTFTQLLHPTLRLSVKAGPTSGSSTEVNVGNALPDASLAVGDDECQHKCNDSDEMCGGTWRLSVYEVDRKYKSDSWTYAACLADNVDGKRTLPNLKNIGGVWSAEACLNAVEEAGLKVGGLEYGAEEPPVDVTVLDADACRMRCNDARDLECGGNYALDVYISNSWVPPSEDLPPTDEVPTAVPSDVEEGSEDENEVEPIEAVDPPVLPDDEENNDGADEPILPLPASEDEHDAGSGDDEAAGDAADEVEGETGSGDEQTGDVPAADEQTGETPAGDDEEGNNGEESGDVPTGEETNDDESNTGGDVTPVTPGTEADSDETSDTPAAGEDDQAGDASGDENSEVIVVSPPEADTGDEDAVTADEGYETINITEPDTEVDEEVVTADEGLSGPETPATEDSNEVDDSVEQGEGGGNTDSGAVESTPASGEDTTENTEATASESTTTTPAEVEDDLANDADGEGDEKETLQRRHRMRRVRRTRH
ncbi:hypothetical protein JCM8547_008491 [Rhodosporidiobolus lusitaniae]